MFCTRTRWSRTCAPTTRLAIRLRYSTGTSTGSSRRESGGATEKMTNNSYVALALAEQWHSFWRGQIGEWIITRGLRIAMWLLASLLLARFINWAAQRITRRLDAGFRERDALGRSGA